jgi:hypothetical protein
MDVFEWTPMDGWNQTNRWRRMSDGMAMDIEQNETKLSSNGMELLSDKMDLRSDETKLSSNETKLSSNGMELPSNGTWTNVGGKSDEKTTNIQQKSNEHHL